MKWALITGASSGIGKELAYIHAKRGGNLIIVARRKDKLEALQQELQHTANGIEVRIIVMDLAEKEAPQELYHQTKGLGIEYLINNAGFGGLGRFYERDWKEDQKMIQLNVLALTELCRLFLPGFVARDLGHILNVSSTVSFLPAGPMQAVYFATKAYVTSFSYALAQELDGTKVSVTALLPGPTETEFAQKSGMDKTQLFRSPCSAATVAKAGYRAMENRKLSVISGLSLSQRLMLSITPLVPKKMVLRVIQQQQSS